MGPSYRNRRQLTSNDLEYVKMGSSIRDDRPSDTEAASPRVAVTTTTSINISIPSEVAQYAPDIRRFVDAMVYKLGVHSKKGRWEGLPISHAHELLLGEVRELDKAIQRGNMVEILLEGADVANYALIISAIAIENGK